MPRALWQTAVPRVSAMQKWHLAPVRHEEQELEQLRLCLAIMGQK